MIRILLAIEPRTLSDQLKRDIESSPGVEIVGQSSSPAETLVLAGEFCVDLVIIAALDNGVPGLCSHLFAEIPDITVIAIAADGESAVIYRSTVSEEKMERITFEGLVAVFDRARTS